MEISVRRAIWNLWVHTVSTTAPYVVTVLVTTNPLAQEARGIDLKGNRMWRHLRPLTRLGNENIQYLQWVSNVNAAGILIELNYIPIRSTELCVATGFGMWPEYFLHALCNISFKRNALFALVKGCVSTVFGGSQDVPSRVVSDKFGLSLRGTLIGGLQLVQQNAGGGKIDWKWIKKFWFYELKNLEIIELSTGKFSK